MHSNGARGAHEVREVQREAHAAAHHAVDHEHGGDLRGVVAHAVWGCLIQVLITHLLIHAGACSCQGGTHGPPTNRAAL